jgi:hypothetical protein
MVRAALAPRAGEPRPGPARRRAIAIPAATVVAASLLSVLPIVSKQRLVARFRLLMLIAWRLLRADAWPAWWAAPLGLRQRPVHRAIRSAFGRACGRRPCSRSTSSTGARCGAIIGSNGCSPACCSSPCSNGPVAGRGGDGRRGAVRQRSPPLVISICVLPDRRLRSSRGSTAGGSGDEADKRFTSAHQSITFSRRMLLVGGAQAASAGC